MGGGMLGIEEETAASDDEEGGGGAWVGATSGWGVAVGVASGCGAVAGGSTRVSVKKTMASCAIANNTPQLSYIHAWSFSPRSYLSIKEKYVLLLKFP